MTATAVEHGGRADASEQLAEIRQAVESANAKTCPHLSKLRSQLGSGIGIERFRWALDVLVSGALKGA